MKIFTIVIFSISLVTITKSQNLSKKIAIYTCEYLDSIDNFQILQDSIQPSIVGAMAKVMIEGTPEERKKLSTVSGIKESLKNARELLSSHCYNVRRLIIEHKKNKFYRLSNSHNANVHYEKGNGFMKTGDLKNAVREFKSAIKIDDKFVFAIDHLAVVYRKQKNYKSAIKYYNKSLEVFPEGDVALLNIAVSYSLIEDGVNSTTNYERLKFLYPNNPEGYFGLAKMLFLKEHYENALDNLFLAHRIYVNSNSEYMKDSEILINIIYEKMKELNKIELFDNKVKEHNITIDN